MQDRKIIDEKYKWDLTLLFKTDEEFKKQKDYAKNKIDELAGFEGKLSTEENILKFFKLKEVVDKLVLKLDVYAFLKISENTADASAIRLAGESNSLVTYYSVKLAFVSPELALLSDALLVEMLNKTEFMPYSRILEGIKKEKPHIISKDKEELLAGVDEFSDFENLFSTITDAELKFDPIKLNSGEELHLNQSNFGLYAKHADREIRKQAHLNFYSGYKKVNLSLSCNYINYLKFCNFKAKTYNFKSSLDMALFNDEIDRSVYALILKSVKDNNSLYQKYIDKKIKLSNITDFSVYDINMPVGDGSKFKLDYDDSVILVKNALSILGREYKSVVDRVFAERWVDVYPSEAKRNGAFSVNCEIPYILLNHEPMYRSISTIAHELGHSVHSYLSEKYQPYFKSQTALFVAEIVSILNEILLAKYILKNETSVCAKRYVADGLLQEFNNNVFNVAMEAELEEFAHTSVNKGEELTFEDLNNKYEETCKCYYGNNVKLTEVSKYSWMRHSQFYTKFYLYKYAFGFLVASNIAKNIENFGTNYVENNYLKFLKGGSSLAPIELLKLAKVDITSEQTYKNAFMFYNELLEWL